MHRFPDFAHELDISFRILKRLTKLSEWPRLVGCKLYLLCFLAMTNINKFLYILFWRPLHREV